MLYVYSFIQNLFWARLEVAASMTMNEDPFVLQFLSAVKFLLEFFMSYFRIGSYLHEF